MSKMKHKIAAILLSAVTLALYGCGSGANANENAAKNVKIWTAIGTEKILQNKTYDRNEQTLKISAFKNEYESAQIILSPDYNVKEYSISLSDLRAQNGDAVLDKENFTVYNEKYIQVTTVKDVNSATGAGVYPDALLPFETAVKYGENKIAKDENQGIWLTLKCPKDQAAGVYAGNFSLTVDGKAYSVPVSVEIYDYTLTDEVSVKTSYGMDLDQIAVAELDSTDEMFKTYFDFFLDYRISSQNLPGNHLIGGLSDESIETFVDYAVEYTKDVRCSHFNIPFQTVSAVNEKGEAVVGVNLDKYEQALKALALRSMEEGLNLFAKAGTYFIFFDEAVINGTMHIANYALKQANEFHQSFAYELEELLEGDETLKAEVISSVRNMKHKLVGSYTEELETAAMYVPTIDQYHSAVNRELYEQAAFDTYGEDGELWSYHCMNPTAPHPTVHTEDALLSSRLMGWMMQQYNIVGSLYWCTALYAWREGERTPDLQLQNYYDTALRFPAANGDGYLVYPGRPYGIYGPVGTVRLHSLRDGFEDYELLNSLQKAYKARGINDENFDAVSKVLTTRLFSGTMVSQTETLSGNFAAARDTLAELLVLSKQGVLIENAKETKSGLKLTVSATEGATLKIGGAEISGSIENGVGRYEITVPLTTQNNLLNLTVEKDGTAYALSLWCGAKQTYLSADAFISAVKETDGLETQKTTFEGEECVQVSVKEADERLELSLSDYAIDKNKSSVKFSLYNAGAQASVVLFVKGSSPSSPYYEHSKLTLESGWNEIVIETSSINFTTLKALSALRIALGDYVGDLYCKDLVITG